MMTDAQGDLRQGEPITPDRRPNLAYQAIAEIVGQQIALGNYPAHSRMPSVRLLADQCGVSLSTAAHAYRELEARGLLRSEARRGYYVIAQVEPAQASSGELLIPEETRDWLSLEQPEFSTDDSWTGSQLPHEWWPAKLIERSLRTVGKQIDTLLCGHLHDPAGHPQLRQQLARHLLTSHGAVPPDHLLLADNYRKALELVLDWVTQPGDSVVVFNPNCTRVFQVLESRGLRIHEIPCTVESGGSIDVLDYICNEYPISAVLAWPNGLPTSGAMLTAAQHQDLYRVTRTHGVRLICTETNADLVVDQGQRLVPDWDASSNDVILIGSMAEQWGNAVPLAWIAAGSRFAQLLTAAVDQNLQAGHLLQATAVHMTAHDDWLAHQKRLRNRIRQIQSGFEQSVSMLLPIGCQSPTPVSGYMRWLRCEPDLAAHINSRAQALGMRLYSGARCTQTERYASDYRFNLTSFDADEWATRFTQLL